MSAREPVPPVLRMSANKKICFFCQPYGIGDVLFLQKAVWHCARLGFRVIYPLRDNLSWLRYYLIRHPDVSYPTLSEVLRGEACGLKLGQEFFGMWRAAEFDFEDKRFDHPILSEDYLFLALGAQWKRRDAELMRGKYVYLGLDHRDWARHVLLKRRPHVERELFYEVLGLADGELFTLVNHSHSCGRVAFSAPGRTVTMREIEGFTAIDWLMVVERAAQVVTVDTSLVLLVELIGQQKPLYMISRYEPPSFRQVASILNLEWTFVPTGEDLLMQAA